MEMLQAQKDKAYEIDELYLYQVRKIIKRQLVQNNLESGVDLQMMIIGTFSVTLCFCLMNTLGLNSQFDLINQQSRYYANYGFVNPLISGSISAIMTYFFKQKIMSLRNGNHLYDIRSTCNGFLAGVVGVSVGSGAMQPLFAFISGIVANACYLLGCIMFRSF
jgi:ammonia channel protein AmtB